MLILLGWRRKAAASWFLHNLTMRVHHPISLGQDNMTLPGFHAWPLVNMHVNQSFCCCLNMAGDNGTIDGQGLVWWTAFHNKSLGYTRGHLVELINSKNILISNLTFQNSPFWTIHPVYCRYSNLGLYLSPIFNLAESVNTFLEWMWQSTSAIPSVVV